MRKIIGVLVGMALVLMFGSANAANNGTGDPLGLIASAAIQPFFSAGPDDTFIEVDSPLDDNDLHVIYFNQFCNRLISRPKFVSYKGVIVFSPDVDLAAGPPGCTAPGLCNGLAAIGRTANNVSLSPIPALASIHVRGYWLNLGQDFVRVVDTIAVDSAETGVVVPADKQTYSPLRSAASFVAPADVPPFLTTIHLICPNSTVYAESGLFAPLFPNPPLVAVNLFGQLYNDDEDFIVDYFVACSCSSMFQLSTITPVYGLFAPSFLTYTELTTYNVVGAAAPPAIALNPPSFTGYRAIQVIGALDGFGRLANGAAYNYTNAGNHFIGLFAPNFTPGIR